MIVRSLDDIKNSEREVVTPGWTSRRLLLADDGMGFSLNETIIPAGAELDMHYKHHLESVLCIAGEGTLKDLATGKEYAIRPGVMYALSGNEHHILKAEKELRTICVFNPPLTGREVHGPDGAYPPADQIKKAS
jgi:L-ectoine synthase